MPYPWALHPPPALPLRSTLILSLASSFGLRLGSRAAPAWVRELLGGRERRGAGGDHGRGELWSVLRRSEHFRTPHPTGGIKIPDSKKDPGCLVLVNHVGGGEAGSQCLQVGWEGLWDRGANIEISCPEPPVLLGYLAVVRDNNPLLQVRLRQIAVRALGGLGEL